jgi:phage shock protein C
VNDRLYRSLDERVAAGVCGGLADRMNLDPALVRVGWVVVGIITGVFPMLVLYVVMALVVPEEPGWGGVRPVGPAPWGPDGSPNRDGGAAWTAGAPWNTTPGPEDPGVAGQAGQAGASSWATAGPAGMSPPGPQGSPTPPGAPPAPDAVPGWVPPGWGAAAGWGPADRRSIRAEQRAARHAARDARRAARRDDPTTAILVGIFLVGLGGFFLVREAFGIDWSLIWPAIIVTIGILVVVAGMRPRGGG